MTNDSKSNSLPENEQVASIVDYENGLLDNEATIRLFQDFIDSGQVWRLPSSYSREAIAMIRAGRCMLGPTGHHDYFGNYVPSRHEVKPGTVGSKEYLDARHAI